MLTTTNYGLRKPEGTDVVDIQNFNDNADIIDQALKKHDSSLSDMTNDRIYYCGTTSGTNTYTVTNSKITAYTEGLTVRIKIGTASTGASTLNINGLGAKTILDSLGNAIVSGGLKAGLPYQLCYNGTNFIVLGKGGGGNVTADKMLVGYNGTSDSGPVVGTMPNNGALGGALAINGTYTIPAGYTSGGIVTQSILTKASATITPTTTDQTIASNQYLSGVQTIKGDVNLLAVNIRSGISIFNVAGTYDPLNLVAGTTHTLYDDITFYTTTVTSGFVYMEGVTCTTAHGIVTVTFNLKAGVVGKTAYGRIYINGIAVGTIRSTTSSTYVSFSENFSINNGDIVQVYAYSGNGGYSADIGELKISCGNNYATFTKS